ncbi:MAG: preprotein translocase subunit SecE [Deltaproteobacteria bacterium]|nr:preprotein translocase subunit SecE [Candidatus Anaeroferrophillacea bacterium]
MAALNEQITTLVQYLRDSRSEVRKVTWPGRKETVGLTWVVLVTVVVISLFLGVVDLGLAKIIKLIIGA